ncbi:unnamed protein product [Chrysoparadoxa australica]
MRLQRCGRAYIARCVMRRMVMEEETRKELRLRAAIRIQTWWLGCMGKYSGQLMADELRRMLRARHRAAMRLQAAMRGMFGRREWARREQVRLHNAAAATKIQKVFRSSRVINWRRIRLNKIGLHILMRQELEFEERKIAAELCNQRRIEAARKDSCSEAEDDGVDNDWQEVWDEVTGATYWWNPTLDQTAEAHPLAYQLSLVGLQCKIYWPNQGETFSGYITRLHKSKGKHRIEYDDGDHEWMNLKEEIARVTIRNVEGTWLSLRDFVDPVTAERRKRDAARRSKEKKNAKLFEREHRWEKLWDSETEKMRWLDPQTGDMFYAKDNADSWYMDQDEEAEIVWVNQDTNEVEYEEPRFTDPGAKAKAHAQMQSLEEIRYALYFCTELSQTAQHYDQLSPKEKKLLLEGLVYGPHPLKLAGAVAAARKAFNKRVLEQQVEVTNAIEMLRYLNELKEWAQQEQKVLEEQKNRFMGSTKRGG